MCSGRGAHGGNSHPNRPSSSRSTCPGAHYALCALGVGLIAMGIVMIVWTVIPTDKATTGISSAPSDNSTVAPGSGGKNGQTTNSSIVAMVLVGVGAVILLLAICLGMKNKNRASSRQQQVVSAQAPVRDHVTQEQEEPATDATTFNVPSYEEVVGSDNYPVRQSNLRQSTTHLPSYEDIIAAVENEGTEASNDATEATPLNDNTPTATRPAAESQADPVGLASNPSLPARSSSRASRLLRPLRVRRIKSDKLHLKDFRIQIRTPTHNPVNIEPITPPPQYENKMPELKFVRKDTSITV